MKNISYLFSLLVLTLFGCADQVSEMVTYTINEPVFMTSETFRKSVKVTSEPKTIDVLGKICFYEGYLYVSEPEKGIHIIDNRQPSTPQMIGFIELLGNADLSIRNGLLYADSFVDLVWFDVSNPALPELKGRLENVFKMALPRIENTYGVDYNMAYNADSTGVVVGWELKERTEDVNKYSGGWYGGWGRPELFAMTDGIAINSTKAGGINGITGSMSRFSIYDGYLYTVINNAMNIFSLDGVKPTKATEDIYIGSNVETIFSYEDNLFMGTPTGMLIYSVKDPLKPEYQSSLQHVFGCDPVVVENDIAYVTIHSGNNCGQENNELIIVDVSNVKLPKQIVSYTMTNPKGLGIDNGKLFLCDDGLKIYNAADPKKIMANELAHYRGMIGFDVIPYNNTLMMIAEDGLYQYDYSVLSNIRQISKIAIGE
ncbi:MAG: hypothetical protein GZ091_12795 [Paludibacter sp.]|nr:hypothetical protein [Paludibacter sp.]